MKKLITFAFLIFVGTSLTAISARSQGISLLVFDNPAGTVATPVTVFSTRSDVNESKVALKATKDFNRAFRNVSGENWLAVKGGYLATFESAGVRTTATYDRRGRWMYNIIRYNERDLNAEVRRTVMGTYFDYSIKLVHEIQLGNQKVYIIHLNKKNNWINVQVMDGEMQEVENLTQPD